MPGRDRRPQGLSRILHHAGRGRHAGAHADAEAAGTAQGKIYALVIGISRYQDPSTYHNLQYADVDARAFYSFLISPTGAKADPLNVDTLYNEGATKEEFGKQFTSIKNRLKKGDQFYIYFSGHGDAYDADLAFLLMYNAPSGNDRDHYITDVGTINIHTIKSLIKAIIAEREANVILITDACRSNELPPGKEKGREIFFEEMYTKNSGEIQLISCLANQVSFEGSQWGGGRGLFSWHLINGLKGLADTRPQDGVVTLKELVAYVSDSVGVASFDKKSGNYLQTPDYCCKKMDGVVMSHVNETEKQKLIYALQHGDYKPDISPLIASVGKGVNLGVEMKAAGLEEEYKSFTKAIEDGQLIAPASTSAYRYLQTLLSANISDNLKSELKYELGGKLMTDVTKVINTYLHAGQNNNKYTYEYFTTAAEKLKAFQNICDTDYYSPKDMNVIRLFLEGHANWHSSKVYVLMESLRKVDSAIAIKPQAAFLYNLKGLTHVALKQYKEAEKTLRQGIALAPNWLYPYHNLARTYTEMGMYDSAFKYFGLALRLDSNYQTTYEGIAGVYEYQNKMDSAIYFLKLGLKKDATDPYIWAELGFDYSRQNKWNEALNSFYQSIHFDPTLFYGYEGVAMVELETSKNQDSVGYYVKKMVATDSTNPSVYKELGYLLQKYNVDTMAVTMFESSLFYDSMNADVWVAAGVAYDKIGKDTLGLGCYFMAAELDTENIQTLNQLGNSYFRLNYVKKAAAIFKKIIALNPKEAVYYYNYAYVSSENKDYVTAEEYYHKALEKNEKYFSAYYELAKLKATQDKPSEAIQMLRQAVKYGEYKRADVDADAAFATLKTNKDFQALLLKLKT